MAQRRKEFKMAQVKQKKMAQKEEAKPNISNASILSPELNGTSSSTLSCIADSAGGGGGPQAALPVLGDRRLSEEITTRGGRNSGHQEASQQELSSQSSRSQEDYPSASQQELSSQSSRSPEDYPLASQQELGSQSIRSLEDYPSASQQELSSQSICSPEDYLIASQQELRSQSIRSLEDPRNVPDTRSRQYRRKDPIGGKAGGVLPKFPFGPPQLRNSTEGSTMKGEDAQSTQPCCTEESDSSFGRRDLAQGMTRSMTRRGRSTKGGREWSSAYRRGIARGNKTRIGKYQGTWYSEERKEEYERLLSDQYGTPEQGDSLQCDSVCRERSDRPLSAEGNRKEGGKMQQPRSNRGIVEDTAKQGNITYDVINKGTIEYIAKQGENAQSAAKQSDTLDESTDGIEEEPSGRRSVEGGPQDDGAVFRPTEGGDAKAHKDLQDSPMRDYRSCRLVAQDEEGMRQANRLTWKPREEDAGSNISEELRRMVVADLEVPESQQRVDTVTSGGSIGPFSENGSKPGGVKVQAAGEDMPTDGRRSKTGITHDQRGVVKEMRPCSADVLDAVPMENQVEENHGQKESLSNGYHLESRQQAHELPTPISEAARTVEQACFEGASGLEEVNSAPKRDPEIELDIGFTGAARTVLVNGGQKGLPPEKYPQWIQQSESGPPRAATGISLPMENRSRGGIRSRDGQPPSLVAADAVIPAPIRDTKVDAGFPTRTELSQAARTIADVQQREVASSNQVRDTVDSDRTERGDGDHAEEDQMEGRLRGAGRRRRTVITVATVPAYRVETRKGGAGGHYTSRIVAIGAGATDSVQNGTSGGATPVKSVTFEVYLCDVIETVLPSSGIFTVKLAKRGQNLGIVITSNQSGHKGEAVIVSDIRTGSVAHRCGSIHPGDQLLAIDNIPLDSCTVEEGVRLLQRSSDIVKLRVKKSSAFINEEQEAPQTVVYSVELNRRGGPLGITIASTDERGDPIIISQLAHGGLAERTGALHTGDRIVAVNNVSLQGKNVSEAMQLLQGSGETVVVKIARCVDPPIAYQHAHPRGYGTVLDRSILPSSAYQESYPINDHDAADKMGTPVQSIDSAVESLEDSPIADSNHLPSSNRNSNSHNSKSSSLSGEQVRYAEELSVHLEKSLTTLSKSGPSTGPGPSSGRSADYSRSIEAGSVADSGVGSSDAGTSSDQFCGCTCQQTHCSTNQGPQEEWVRILEALETVGEAEMLRKLEESIMTGSIPNCDTSAYTSFSSKSPSKPTLNPPFPLTNTILRHPHMTPPALPPPANGARSDSSASLHSNASSATNGTAPNFTPVPPPKPPHPHPYASPSTSTHGSLSIATVLKSYESIPYITSPVLSSALDLPSTSNTYSDPTVVGGRLIAGNTHDGSSTPSSIQLSRGSLTPSLDKDAAGAGGEASSGAESTTSTITLTSSSTTPVPSVANPPPLLPLVVHRVSLFKDREYNDFGFSVSDSSDKNVKGVYINTIRPAGPADLSGNVKPLDKLLQVNGTSLEEMDCYLAVPLLQSSGNRVELFVQRDPQIKQRPESIEEEDETASELNNNAFSMKEATV